MKASYNLSEIVGSQAAVHVEVEDYVSWTFWSMLLVSETHPPATMHLF